MAALTVRPGDVYKLPILGDNGETKWRVCVVLRGYPIDHAPEVVLIIFGCSNTRGGFPDNEVKRVEPDNRVWFNKLHLKNGTTFHASDVRFYDAKSPRLQLRERVSTCPHSLFIELRKLLDIHVERGGKIPLLPPEKASENAKLAAKAFLQDQSTRPTEDS